MKILKTVLKSVFWRDSIVLIGFFNWPVIVEKIFHIWFYIWLINNIYAHNTDSIFCFWMFKCIDLLLYWSEFIKIIPISHNVMKNIIYIENLNFRPCAGVKQPNKINDFEWFYSIFLIHEIHWIYRRISMSRYQISFEYWILN